MCSLRAWILCTSAGVGVMVAAEGDELEVDELEVD